MASSKDYFFFVMDLLREVPNLSYRKMMGEYVFYSGSIIFGGVYDNRFLVKKTDQSSKLGYKEVIPYPSGKPMLLIDSEDSDEIEEIVRLVVSDLKKSP